METKYLSSAGTFSKNPEMFGMGKDFYIECAGEDGLTPKVYFHHSRYNFFTKPEI